MEKKKEVKKGNAAEGGNPICEAYLYRMRLGDETCTASLNEVMNARRESYINAALVDVNYKFSPSDRDYVYRVCLDQAIKEYCFQSTCGFISYFVLLMKYMFINMAKSHSEYIASINPGLYKEPVNLLRDCSQRDNNDLMQTLFSWKDDILQMAAASNKFSDRDFRIINLRCDDVPFAKIAEQIGCSLSTCKKVWKKFIEYVKDILNVRDVAK